MDLSSQDSLRLNVLLRQNVMAIRIDEGRMTVHALTDRGEATVSLNANTGDDRYLKLVRQMISSHVLDSPGGYPVYIQRWTRMNQVRTGNIEKLLLLGEPEAVTAAVYSDALTAELAERAWWCRPESEIAREMLRKPAIAESAFATELAAHLLEFLPFEESPKDMMDSVALVLQGDLTNDEQRAGLWKGARRKNPWLAGFVLAGPAAIPEAGKAHPLYETLARNLSESPENLPLQALVDCYSARGQQYLSVLSKTLEKLSDQDVTIGLFNHIGRFYRWHHFPTRHREWQELEDAARRLIAEDKCLLSLLAERDDLEKPLLGLCCLSLVDENLLNPYFGGSDAMGTVMRKQIKPLLDHLERQLRQLM